jgi:CheY-like chemotaxis protein
MGDAFTNKRPLHVLIVDDDDEDVFFAKKALGRSQFPSTIDSAANGVEMMDYLHKNPLPDLILLDLNMPMKNGKEALVDLRADEELRHIPVVLFTTSGAEQDILTCYRLGANSYIRKPVSFDAMVETMSVLKEYWAQFVALPTKRQS